MCQPCHGLVEPEWLWSQGGDPSVCAPCELARVTASQVWETEASRGPSIEAVAGRRTPRPATLAGLPRCQKGGTAVAQESLGAGLSWEAAHSGRLGQVLPEGLEGRKRQGASRSEWLAEVAPPLFPCPRPWQATIGRLPCGGACDRQAAWALPQQVEEAVGLFGIRLTRAVRPGLRMVPSGWAGHQADLIATACEPCGAGLPVDTGGCHGAQDRLRPVCDQVGCEGRCKASEALPGRGQCALTTAHGGRRPQPSPVFGFADLNSSEEEVRLGYGRFTLRGGSSILW
jgi:hypothetical protein